MSSDSSAQPFGTTAGNRVTVYGAQGRPEVASFLPEQAFLAEPGALMPADVVILVVGSAADLAHDLAGAAAAVEADGVLWVCYPTAVEEGAKELDINRDTVASLLETSKWQPLADVALGEKWAAVRGRAGE
ncbi:hypothetical protein QNO00_14045 [Arthrobacter sp. zg-Y1219]|uniref:hypothetical protein n=1 Tax=Arthrobacter sp. zg-Y1219 TaxID=3049067 RepID=UPI0024C415E8|nr:hypothetical protein [Arthrobacter sp. zg-Y1219]MDK1361382.1 hypothetical protein [Arthrobacter sp. zg-Y1219]